VAVLIRRLEEQDEVAAFDCGDEALNNYLKGHAWANQQKSSIGVTNVALDEGAPLSVIGYFTLATASVPRDAFPKKYVRGLPPYDLPLILLARLAVDRRFSGKGLGGHSSEMPTSRQHGFVRHYGLVRDARHEALPVMVPFRRSPARPSAVQLHHRPSVLPLGSP
jgi:hypothetical protein